jgi:hypothetical protein
MPGQRDRQLGHLDQPNDLAVDLSRDGAGAIGPFLEHGTRLTAHVLRQAAPERHRYLDGGLARVRTNDRGSRRSWLATHAGHVGGQRLALLVEREERAVRRVGRHAIADHHDREQDEPAQQTLVVRVRSQLHPFVGVAVLAPRPARVPADHRLARASWLAFPRG